MLHRSRTSRGFTPRAPVSKRLIFVGETIKACATSSAVMPFSRRSRLRRAPSSLRRSVGVGRRAMARSHPFRVAVGGASDIHVLHTQLALAKCYMPSALLHHGWTRGQSDGPVTV